MGQGQGRMGGGPGGHGMQRGGPGMEPLVMRPDVIKELKLSESQQKKIKALFPGPGGRDGMRSGPGGPGGPEGGVGRDDREGRGGQNEDEDDDRGGPPQDRRGNDDEQGPGGPPPRRGGDDEGPGGPGRQGGQRGGGRGMGGEMRGGPDQMDSKLGEILSDGQMKRLKQLRIQREGALALMRPDIGDKVGLSDRDRDRIHDMIDSAMDSMRPQDGDRPDHESMEKMHAKLSDKILSSLSSKQRSKWNDLAGKPFKFDANWHPEGRGGDNRRGGPGGRDGQRGPGQRGGRDDDDRGGPPPSDNDGDGGSVEQGIIDATVHHG